MEQHVEDSAVSVVFETKIINQILAQCSFDTIKSIRRLNRAIQRSSRDFVLRHFSIDVREALKCSNKPEKCKDQLKGQSIWNRELWENISGVVSGPKTWMKRVTKIKYADFCEGVVRGLPDSVRTVHLGSYFNREVTHELGSQITRLTFGMFFNRKVDDLPSTLNYLEFGYYFDREVDHLPSKLTHLTFGYGFDRKVNRLPKTLIVLNFGWRYNQITDHLPPSLTDLEFGAYFNQNIDNLPPSLVNLRLGAHFNQKVDYLPESLKTLKLGHAFQQSVDNLPSRLTKLAFGYAFNENVAHLPEHLEFVKFGSSFKKPLLWLPKSVKTIILSDDYDGPINDLSPGCIITCCEYITNERFVGRSNYRDYIVNECFVERWQFDGTEYKPLHLNVERKRQNHGVYQVLSECT